MIVTCQECSTSFQLDDARIPATGARVRCSRCKHAFYLPNPSASQSATVQAVVEQVVAGKLGGTPEPTRDLDTRAGPARGAAPVRNEPEEEDWQFSQEIRVAGDDERDEVEVASTPPIQPRADSFDLTGDFGRGFDPGTPSGVEASPSAPAPAASAAKPASGEGAAATRAAGTPTSPAPVRDESSFGSIDDFSSLIDDDDLSIDLATAPTPAPTSRSSARPVARRAAAGRGAAEDLGDPESWDLVGAEGARRATSRLAASDRTQTSSRKPNPASGSRSAGLDLFADAELPPIRDELEASSAQAGVRWAALGRGAGWALTLVSVAVVFGLLIRPEWSRRVTEPQRLAIDPFVAETGRAGWLESSRSGTLLVFEGELRNSGPAPLRPIPLQLTLLDRSGERLSDPPIEIGTPLDEATLREAAPDELALRRAEAVSSWLAEPLLPGEARRFTAVAMVSELPDAARRVALEAGRADGR